MSRISQNRFDSMVLELLSNCSNLAERNCDYCPQCCVLYYKLKEQEIEDTPDIMNTLRKMFLDELALRDKAIRNGPRYKELTSDEYYSILSNKNHFRIDINDQLYAIY